MSEMSINIRKIIIAFMLCVLFMSVVPLLSMEFSLRSFSSSSLLGIIALGFCYMDYEKRNRQMDFFISSKLANFLSQGIRSTFIRIEKESDLNELSRKLSKVYGFKEVKKVNDTLLIDVAADFMLSFGEKLVIKKVGHSLLIKSSIAYFPFPVFDFGRNLKNIRTVLEILK